MADTKLTKEENWTLVNDIDNIIREYLGENKYKKVIEEYQSKFKSSYNNKKLYCHNCTIEINTRILDDYSYYSSSVLGFLVTNFITKKRSIVKVPRNYYYSMNRVPAD